MLAILAAEAGAASLFTENLWPVDFLRIGGFDSQEAWAPFDLESVVATLARAGVYLSLLAALIASRRALLASARRASGCGRCGRWPRPSRPAAVIDVAWRVLGIWSGARVAVQHESTHLLIGMSWLPALGFAACAVVAVRFCRGGLGSDLRLLGLRPRSGRRRRGARRPRL